jgi:hypothetical protein
MAAPLLVPLILLGGATIALAASSAKKKRAANGAEPTGPAKTYTLDGSLPAPLRDQVLAALASSTDPAKLESFAATIAPSYPLSAAALRAKAAALRALQGIPSVPATPTTPVSPPPPVQPPVQPAQLPAQPLADWQAQIMSLPEPTRTQVLQAMMGMNDPNALEAFAKQLEAQYPVAAWALRVREAALRGQAFPAMPATPSTPATPTVAPPITPATPTVQPASPASPPAPQIPVTPAAPAIPTTPIVPSLGPLDPGMPIEMQKAVAGALTTEMDPAKLEGFASAIQAQYPIAAGLLMAKAQALRLTQTPHILPATPVTPKPPVLPAPPASHAPAILPFPASGTYTVQSGDYPIMIAQKFTGNGMAHWKELIAANPEKPTRDDGAWKTLFPGETVTLPQSWNKNAKTAAALPPAGGTHAAHA